MKSSAISKIFSNEQLVQIQIEGNLISNDSAKINRELSNVLTSCQSIEIHFKEINSIDMSVLQMLAALQKKAVKEEKQITFYFEGSEYLSNILNNSVYNKFLSA